MLLPLILVLALLFPAAAIAQTQQNVVVFLTDDQTVRQAQYMRGVQQLLAQQGTSFTRSYATFPLCCPSRATLITGQYAHNHGVLHNDGLYGGYKRLDHAETLPVWLQRAGYRTLQVGRWLNGYGIDNPDQTEIPPGWNEWFAPVGASSQSYLGQTINENGVLRFFNQYQADLYADKAVELIRGSPSPFFLNMTFSAPHRGGPADPDDPRLVTTPSPAPRHRDLFAGTALPAPPSFNELDVADKPQDVLERPPLTPEIIAAIQENWQQELESLQSVDDAVGRVMAELNRQDRLEQTLFVFTSDNGFMHGEHRIPSEKVWPYEESARVPLVLRGPGVPRDLQLGQLTGNIDVVPTILEATGARAGVPLDGRSLFGLMEDPTLEWGRDLLLESGYGANGVGGFSAIRNNGFLYIAWTHSGEYELYDMRRDPWQLENLDGEYAYEEQQADLARRLRTLASCFGVSCRRPPALNLRSSRRCKTGSQLLTLAGGDLPKVRRVDFYRGRSRSRLGRRDRRAPFQLELKRPRRVRARAELRYGRIVTLDRRVSRVAPCPSGRRRGDRGAAPAGPARSR